MNLYITRMGLMILCMERTDVCDASFYKLLDEITSECEVLMAKGIVGTGVGFDAPGSRLDKSTGSDVMHYIRLS